MFNPITLTTNSDSKQKVALSSVFAGLALTLGKTVVGLITGSMGILSEAAHSALDLVAAVMTYFAVRIGDKPADEDHPYGHGKVESVSALIETGLLFLTSAWIIYEAINRLFFEEVKVEAPWYAFVVVIISILIDVSRSRALSKVAKATNSQALEADALHFSSDIWSSAVVLMGLVLLRFFNINGADSIAALVVAIFVAFAGYRLGKRTIDVLIDTAPEGLREKMFEIAKGVEGVLDVKQVRVRLIGAGAFVDMTVYVSRKLPLVQANKIASAVVESVRKQVPETDIIVHTKPLSVDSETIIDRVHIAAANQNLEVHDVAVHTEGTTKFLSYNLEVDEKLNLKKAHEIATKFEQHIHEEIGNDVVIDTHIDPANCEIILDDKVSAGENERIEGVLNSIAKSFKEISYIHNVKIHKTHKKFFVSLHYLLPKEMILEDVQDLASRFEFSVKEKLDGVEHIVVHAEPMIHGLKCHHS